MKKAFGFYSVLAACMLAALIGQAVRAEDHLYDWTRAFGRTGDDFAQSEATDSSGSVYIGGYFQNTVDFDP